MRKPRLIHVTTTDISLVLLLGSQLREFADAGFEVFAASAPGPFVEQLRDWGITHLPLRHATRAMAPHHDLMALAELRSVFVSLRPDIVHTHNPKPGIYGRLAARSAGVPAVVNTVHGLYAQPCDHWRKRAFVYGLERLAGSCSDIELVQNPEDLETLANLGVPRAKLRLLGSGVDLRWFDPDRIDGEARRGLREEMGAEPGAVIVAAIGRLVKEKGYLELFAAAERVRRRLPEALFVVVGPVEPDKADSLPRDDVLRAEAAGVRFLGLRDDVDRLYSAADVYVLASHREGFPRSAMEAAAMGLPIVTTDIRGCRQVVADGVNGRLVAKGDVESLATAIAELVASPEKRLAMGAAGRRKAATEFDERHVIDLTVEVYNGLLARSTPRLVA